MFIDLLLVYYLVNTTCAIINIMANLIFTIVSLLHAFFLVVPSSVMELFHFFVSRLLSFSAKLLNSFVQRICLQE